MSGLTGGDSKPVENLEPTKVDNINTIINSRGYFKESTLSLLKTNPNDWFIIADYRGSDYLKQANIYESSCRYWREKLMRTENIKVESFVKRYRKKQQAMLVARVVEEK